MTGPDECDNLDFIYFYCNTTPGPVIGLEDVVSMAGVIVASVPF